MFYKLVMLIQFMQFVDKQRAQSFSCTNCSNIIFLYLRYTCTWQEADINASSGIKFTRLTTSLLSSKRRQIYLPLSALSNSIRGSESQFHSAADHWSSYLGRLMMLLHWFDGMSKD